MKHEICAAIYAIEVDPHRQVINQNLLVAKTRVAPTDQTIPRLELVAAVTLAKLHCNVVATLKDVDILENRMWSDSSTVLHWLKDQGRYSVFVKNRVKQIKDLSTSIKATWLHVPTADNPADQGTRANKPEPLTNLWLKGPAWMSGDDWPQQPEILETEESNKERSKSKTERVMMTQQIQPEAVFAEEMAAKYSYWKLLRITAWIRRFKNNVGGGQKTRGPLVTDELNGAEQQWIKMVQHISPEPPKDVETIDDGGITLVKTRVPGYTPILLPQRGEFTRRTIEHFHLATLHGGVQSTMAKLRERFWIPSSGS